MGHARHEGILLVFRPHLIFCHLDGGAVRTPAVVMIPERQGERAGTGVSQQAKVEIFEDMPDDACVVIRIFARVCHGVTLQSLLVRRQASSFSLLLAGEGVVSSPSDNHYTRIS